MGLEIKAAMEFPTHIFISRQSRNFMFGIPFCQGCHSLAKVDKLGGTEPDSHGQTPRSPPKKFDDVRTFFDVIAG